MAYQATPRRRSAAPTQYKFKLDNMYGIDLTNDASNVHLNYSPNCTNMIRDTLGKPRKRTGYHLLDTGTGKINGFHKLVLPSEEKYLIHIGTKLYEWDNTNKKIGSEKYSGSNDKRSKSIQIQGKLYVFDGKKLLQYDGTSVVTVESVAYVPTVLIAKTPTGGGAAYEPVNLLQPKRIETFLGTTSATVYQLGAINLTSIDEVWVMNNVGVFELKEEGVDYTVNLTLGQVIFTPAPGESPIPPEPNVKIIYSKNVSGYADRINKCDICTLYGVNGSFDRIFASGNDDFPNSDWYCQLNNPTYWGDLWYSVLGQDTAKITGYSMVDNYLATHKDKEENNANIFLRIGQVNNLGEAMFPVVNNYLGYGSISKYAHSTVANEPLFLTTDGIYAVATNDVIGNKITALRSKYLNGGLLKEDNLNEAVAITYKEFYMLCIDDKVYILDSQHYTGDTYVHRQYDGYLWTNIPVRSIWELDGELMFGDDEGNIYEFYSNSESNLSYNDNGEPIYAMWTTPIFYGNEFSFRKNFSYFSALLGASTNTSCKVYALYDNEKELILEYIDLIKYFSYDEIDYGSFSYNVDKSPQTAKDKIKINKIDKIQFILENDELNQPFRLYEVMAIYSESR